MSTLTEEERKRLVDALMPSFADYYARPVAYDFEFFHASWCEKLHAMACSLAATRGRACLLNEAHISSAVGTAVSHWGNMKNDWRPPRDLNDDEWEDIIRISEQVGVRGMTTYRTSVENRRVTKFQSKPSTLAELDDGDYFIAFPTDGDDLGHGGFREGSYLMHKVCDEGSQCQYWRSVGLVESSGPMTMRVLKILVR